ncbi:MAG TPA: hypothetical protein DEF51_29900 [Myxococcales bacterium]|nr:hypothetical protein [Myxococcales bacterium]
MGPSARPATTLPAGTTRSTKPSQRRSTPAIANRLEGSRMRWSARCTSSGSSAPVVRFQIRGDEPRKKT